MMKTKLQDDILEYVLKELENRDILDKDAYENCFGCKSFDEVAKQIKKRYLANSEGKKPDYKKAYLILMEYWDSISDEEKPEADKRLKACGL
jgi:hypothetical protein